MKSTDYCPRAAPFDAHLIGENLVGVEVGVDVGAHAEALLRFCDVSMLHLIDPWPNQYSLGFCEGRLTGFRRRYQRHIGPCEMFFELFGLESLDFVYVDEEHDGDTARLELERWWPRLKIGGILGYRNYSSVHVAMKLEIDTLCERIGIPNVVEVGEIVLFKS